MQAAPPASVSIRRAVRADLPRLREGLARLAGDMDDPFRADDAALDRHGFGDDPIFSVQLAEGGGETVGVCLYWPIFSTMKGGAGLYVSDLWVAEAARGMGLGRRLLAAAKADAAARWDAGFIKLEVYVDNPKAAAMYARLGFEGSGRERALVLSGAAFDALGDPA